MRDELCSKIFQLNIETNGVRLVRSGPRRLALTSLRTEQTCIKDMLEGDILSPVIVLGHHHQVIQVIL